MKPTLLREETCITTHRKLKKKKGNPASRPREGKVTYLLLFTLRDKNGHLLLNCYAICSGQNTTYDQGRVKRAHNRLRAESESYRHAAITSAQRQANELLRQLNEIRQQANVHGQRANVHRQRANEIRQQHCIPGAEAETGS